MDFLVFVFAELSHTPMAQHPRMQKILIDCGEFVLQYSIQMLQDCCVAAHDNLPEASSLDTLAGRITARVQDLLGCLPRDRRHAERLDLRSVA
jgi:hypothetical protein